MTCQCKASSTAAVVAQISYLTHFPCNLRMIIANGTAVNEANLRHWGFFEGLQQERESLALTDVRLLR